MFVVAVEGLVWEVVVFMEEEHRVYRTQTLRQVVRMVVVAQVRITSVVVI
jgi:hypothetical protein